jgi:beta-xylosidase
MVSWFGTRVPFVLGLVLAHIFGAVSTILPPQIKKYDNPVIYSDYADNDIFLGPDGKTFYFSASNMHYSPGAPILKSLDLVNWEPIAHSVPALDFEPRYNMTDNITVYNGGTWASSMRFRKSNGLWYWIGCIHYLYKTKVYTAPDVTGPWTLSATLDKCYYDCGLFVDFDDTMYVVYGNTNISIAQLSPDGLSQVRDQPVFNSPPPYNIIEGSRLYKKDGYYYVLADWPTGATMIWRSKDIWSGWTHRVIADSLKGPIEGGGVNCQGSLVETPGGDWYFMSFTWSYPVGRMPFLVPITWTSDGWPVYTPVNGSWGGSYEYPLPKRPTPSWLGTDKFKGHKLSAHWEWNHNPDTSKFKVSNGLTLGTASVVNDLFKARNTLTHRVYGPFPEATIELDFKDMADGDRGGLAAFRDKTSWIGVIRDGSKYRLTMLAETTLNQTSLQQTTSLGTVKESLDINKGKVWLRGALNVSPTGDQQGHFLYSLDGKKYHGFGSNFTMTTSWRFFMGERWGIFNYATKKLGGSIHIASFTQK